MAKKKTEFDKAVGRAARIILDQLSTLPAETAKQKRLAFEQMALNASRAAKNGKRSRSAANSGDSSFNPIPRKNCINSRSSLDTRRSFAERSPSRGSLARVCPPFGMLFPLKRVPNFLFVSHVGRMV